LSTDNRNTDIKRTKKNKDFKVGKGNRIDIKIENKRREKENVNYSKNQT